MQPTKRHHRLSRHPPPPLTLGARCGLLIVQAQPLNDGVGKARQLVDAPAPADHFHAVVDIGELKEQSVFAAQFLSNWTLLKEGRIAA
jgi:hypothetical protein